MSCKKKLPTKAGWYYWREVGSEVWHCVYFDNQRHEDGRIYLLKDGGRERFLDELGGVWGGEVPAPGTTFTAEVFSDDYLIIDSCEKFIKTHPEIRGLTVFQAHLLIDVYINAIMKKLANPEDGIAAVTKKRNKQ